MFTFSETAVHPTASPPDADPAPADVESGVRAAIEGAARGEPHGAEA